jgi:hypothetical protein
MHCLAGRDIDNVALVLAQQCGDGDRLLRFNAAGHPLDGADAHTYRLVRRPRRSTRVEDGLVENAFDSRAEPPYSSVRRFVSGEMNDANR